MSVCEECGVEVDEGDDLCPKCFEEWDGLTIEELVQDIAGEWRCVEKGE